MKKVRIAQATLVFGVAAGLLVALPGFLKHGGSDGYKGLILVNGRTEGTEVAVGTKLPGRVLTVRVAEGQQVKAGELMVELEGEDVRAAYDQAQANVVQAQHNLQMAHERVIRCEAQQAQARTRLELTQKQTSLGIRQAQAAVKETEAAVKQARALLNKARTEFENARELHQQNAASSLELSYAKDALEAQQAAVQMVEYRLEQSEDTYKLAGAQESEIQISRHELTVRESAVRGGQSSVGIAQAQLRAAEATARIFKIKLQDTRIHAPCDGIVVTRVVEPGEVVAAGATVAVIIDFDQLYLKAYLPSDLVSKIKLNDPARVYLDRDRFFTGKITKIHQQAEFTPKNVDTFQQRVKLVFGLELRVDNRDRQVKPGMPADAVIKIDPQAEWRRPTDLR